MDLLTLLMHRLDELGEALDTASEIADDTLRTEELVGLQKNIEFIYQMAKEARDDAAVARQCVCE